MKLLSRSTVGLLYDRHRFGAFRNDFISSEWDVPGTELTKNIYDGELQLDTSASSYTVGVIRNNVIVSRSKSLIYMRGYGYSGTPRLGLAGHISDINPASVDAIVMNACIGAVSSALLREYVNGVSTDLDPALTDGGTLETSYNFALFLNALAVASEEDITAVVRTGTANTNSSGQLGIYFSRNSSRVFIFAFVAQSDRYLTVNGLQSGDVVEVRSGTDSSVLATTTATGSSVNVDMLNVNMIQNYGTRVVVVRSSVDIASFDIGPGLLTCGGDVYSLDENQKVLDGIYARYHSEPLSRFANGVVYTTGIDCYGRVYITSYNTTTGAIAKTLIGSLTNGDAHGSPAVLVDSDGYIWVFYSNHGTETSMYYRKSTNPYDISSFASEQTLAFGYNVTYPQVFQTSTGRIVLICRAPSGTNNTWQVRWSDDDGATWQTARTWLSSLNYTYFKSKQHSDLDTISGLISWHRTLGSSHDVYMVRINLNSGDITVPGSSTPLANLYTGSALDPTTALQVFADSASSYGWPDDVNEFGDILLTVWDPADKTAARYKYRHVDELGMLGSVQDIVATGTSILNTAASLYFGGQVLAGSGVVVLCRENAGEWSVDRYATSNGGTSWTSQRLDTDSDDGLSSRNEPIIAALNTSGILYCIYTRSKCALNTDFVQSADMLICSYLSEGVTNSLNDSAQLMADSLAYSLVPYALKSLADQAKIILDSVNYNLAYSMMRNIKDTAQIMLGEAVSIDHPAFHGEIVDRAQVISELITYGLVNLKAPVRWVAPLTITPKAESGIAPIHLAAYPVRHPAKYFQPRIKSYGAFSRAITAPVGFVRTGDVSVQVIDADNSIRRSIYQKTIKKADVDLRLGPENGKFSSFLRPWKRKVSSVHQPQDGILAFNLKDNIFDLLDRKFPTVITEDNFPNLPENLTTTWANHVIGDVNAPYGAVPCTLVDTVLNQYLVNLYISKSVDAVYRKTANPEPGEPEYELVSPSEYSVIQTKFLDHYDGGGLYCTLIQFNSSQGGQAIRANLHGIYDPDTGNLLYTNFADYILGIVGYLAILNNLGDVINYDSFDEVREKTADLVCAGAVTSPLTYGEWLTRLQRSSNIDLYADKNDRIAVHYTYDDELPTLDLGDLLHLYKGSVKQMTADPVYNRFQYKYAPNFADNTWTEKIYDNEEDKIALGEIAEDPEDIQLYFIRDAATALEVIRRRAQYCTLESFKFEGSIPLIPVLETIELARLIRVSHFGGFDAEGYLNKQFKILELTTDIDNLKCNFKGIVRKLPPPPTVITTPDGDGSGGDADTEREGISNVMDAYNCRPGPFSNGIAGEFFAFFKKGGAGPYTDIYKQKKVQCFYTNNYGVTWTHLDPNNEPITVNPINSYDCCVDTYANDGIVHIAISETTGECRHFYVTFNMNTKTWGTSELVTTTPGLYMAANVSIECRYPGGEPVIFYQGLKRPGTIHPTILYSHVYYAIKIGGVWSAGNQVTPDGVTAEFWGPGTAYADFHFYVQRMLPGRDNRMHFFIMATPWYRQYLITMNTARVMNYPPRYYKQGKQMGHIGVTEGWASADKKTFLLLKRYFSYLFVDYFSDGSTLTFNRSTEIEDAPAFTGDYTARMAGFFGEHNGQFYLNKHQASTSSPIIHTHQHRTSGNGYDWSSKIQSSSNYDPGSYRLYGKYIVENGQAYIASFSGSDFPTFRWQRVSSLPYGS